MERRDEPPARCLGLGWPRGSPVTPQPSDAGLVRRPRLCVPRGRQVAPHRARIAVPSSLRRRERLASRRGRSRPLLKLEPSVYPFPTSPDGRTIDSPRILCVVSHPVRVAVTAALLCLPSTEETDHDADARRVRRAGVRMARGASRPQTCRSRVCQGRRGGVGGGGHCHRPSGKPRWAGTVRCSAPRLLPAPPPRYLSASPGPVSLSHHLLLEFCCPISTSKLRRSCLFIVRLLSVHYYLFEEIISFPLFSLV